MLEWLYQKTIDVKYKKWNNEVEIISCETGGDCHFNVINVPDSHQVSFHPIFIF